MDEFLMGKGSPQKTDSIPTPLIVDAMAKEGLFYSAYRRLVDAFRPITKGDESPEIWKEVTEARMELVSRSISFTKAVQAIERSQERA